MSILFSSFLKDSAFEVKNRRDIRELYETVKGAVKDEVLQLEGHTLPASFNDWIRQVEGDKKLPKRDVDVVDFSLADDKKYAAWRNNFLQSKNPVVLSQGAKDLLEAVKDMDTANSASMTLMNGTKDDVVAALSDLQAAVYMFMSTYDRVGGKLALPERDTPLERVKVGRTNSKAKTEENEAGQEQPKKVRLSKRRSSKAEDAAAGATAA